MTEQEFVAQKPLNTTVAGKPLTIEPPTVARLQEAMFAAFDLLKTTEVIDKAKTIGLKLYQDKLAAVDGDAAKVNLEDLKNEASTAIIEAVKDLFIVAPPELTKLMAVICKPNGLTAKTPEPFASQDFWINEVTVSEAVMVISAFVALIDIAPLLKNVRALKGVA